MLKAYDSNAPYPFQLARWERHIQEADSLLIRPRRDEDGMKRGVEHLMEALRIWPGNPRPYSIASMAACIGEEYELAECNARRAMALDPDCPFSLVALGLAIQERDSDGAEALYREALKRLPEGSPQSGEVYRNLADIRARQFRFPEAENFLDTSERLNPSDPSPQWRRAELRLLQGEYAGAWAGYEQRFRVGYSIPDPKFSEPRWNGEPLRGERVLIASEGGYGDHVQFLRYGPQIQALGGMVILECPPRLIPLAQSAPGIDLITPAKAPLPQFDKYLPIMSLPYALKTTQETIPSCGPYLSVEPGDTEKWRAGIGGGFLNVGLSWAASGSRRSIPLALFEPLARIPGVRLFGLQRGPDAAELKMVAFPITDLEQQAGGIVDTAAAMSALDLIVSIDSMTAHLAGALGRPVFTLLLNYPDWRWMLNRSDTPWYPTMRLFRQPKPGDWQSAIAEVVEAVERRAVV